MTNRQYGDHETYYASDSYLSGDDARARLAARQAARSQRDVQGAQYSRQAQRYASGEYDAIEDRDTYARQQAAAQRQYEQQRAARQQQAAQRNPYSRTYASDRYAAPVREGAFRAAVRGGSNERSSSPMRTVLPFAIIAAIIFLAVLWFTVLSPISITINDEPYEVPRNLTVDQVIERTGFVTTPGRLLAIDESVIDEKGGRPYSATLNDERVDGTAKVAKNAVLQIGPGSDVTEEYTETTVPIPAVWRDSDTYGAIHEIVGSQTDGLLATRVGNVSGITLEGVVAQEADDAILVRYNIDTGGEKIVALTFDDGPWPDQTEQVIDILERNGAKATFFIVGECVDNIDASVWQRMIDNGYQLGTHTFDHADGSGRGVNLGYMSEQEQIDEVVKGQEAITTASGTECSKAMRAPGGNFSFETAGYVKPYVTMDVGWNIDTMDWSRPGSDAIYDAILSCGPGDVILMHDGGGDRSQTIEALAQALPELRNRGYRFVTIDELIAADTGNRANAIEKAKNPDAAAADTTPASDSANTPAAEDTSSSDEEWDDEEYWDDEEDWDDEDEW